MIMIFMFPFQERTKKTGVTKIPNLRKLRRRAIQSMLNPSVDAARSIILLSNGHLSKCDPPIHTYNTCPLDSVYYMFVILYADNESFKMKMDELKTDSPFLKMVVSMFSNLKLTTKKKALLDERNELLLNISEKKTILTSIDCSGNVYSLMCKLLPKDFYSLKRVKRCERCDSEFVSLRCFLDIDIDVFASQPIANLNSHLLDVLISERTTQCECGGERKLQESTFSDLIMIDLQMKNHVKEFTLSDVPATLDILGIIFKVFGCIEFIPPHEMSNSGAVGHYVSHVIRCNKRWEKYDDLLSNVTKSRINNKLRGQVLFYVNVTRQNEI